jgi:hypothetical protein
MDRYNARNGVLIDGKMFIVVCVLNVGDCPCWERWGNDKSSSSSPRRGGIAWPKQVLVYVGDSVLG